LTNRSPVNHHREITAILLLAAAALFSVACYLPASRTGWLGSLLLELARGLFGVGAYALPPLLSFFAVEFLLCRNNHRTEERMTFVALLLIVIFAFLHVLTVDQQALQSRFSNADGTPSSLQALAELWRLGIDPALEQPGPVLPGGLISGLLAQSFLALAGPVGAGILLMALILALLVLTFNVSYTHAAQTTASALHRQKSLSVEPQPALPPRPSYDIELMPETDEEKRRTLLEGWQNFWNADGLKKQRRKAREEQLIP
jgi:S-DNA-T family DNA segregation ATPase FtsK/SpoIIIE